MIVTTIVVVCWHLVGAAIPMAAMAAMAGGERRGVAMIQLLL